jgi:hypothetical protein
MLLAITTTLLPLTGMFRFPTAKYFHFERDIEVADRYVEVTDKNITVGNRNLASADRQVPLSDHSTSILRL